MMNDLYTTLSANNPIIAQFNQFRATFTGDAKSQVEQLLRTGKMTQAQYNELQAKARVLYDMIPH